MSRFNEEQERFNKAKHLFEKAKHLFEPSYWLAFYSSLCSPSSREVCKELGIYFEKFQLEKFCKKRLYKYKTLGITPDTSYGGIYMTLNDDEKSDVHTFTTDHMNAAEEAANQLSVVFHAMYVRYYDGSYYGDPFVLHVLTEVRERNLSGEA
jgi:hypothetical protein